VIDITVAIPTIAPRAAPGGLLERALRSVSAQTSPPSGGTSCALDVDKVGAAGTRQRALDAVRTEWVAFLDDDDTWYPHHLSALSQLAEDTGAAYLFTWFDGNNPFPAHRGRAFDVTQPHHTTMTVMVKTELARVAGFIQPDGPMHQDWAGEDWQFTLRCAAELVRRHGVTGANARFAGTGDVTWTYHVHGGNTSGLPTRW
jgi:hypothetical protein